MYIRKNEDDACEARRIFLEDGKAYGKTLGVMNVGPHLR